MNTIRTVVGVDTTKRVFQLYWVDMETGEIIGLGLTQVRSRVSKMADRVTRRRQPLLFLDNPHQRALWFQCLL